MPAAKYTYRHSAADYFANGRHIRRNTVFTLHGVVTTSDRHNFVENQNHTVLARPFP